jgi:hypothetical protein
LIALPFCFFAAASALLLMFLPQNSLQPAPYFELRRIRTAISDAGLMICQRIA